jgi:hypothetical protein
VAMEADLADETEADQIFPEKAGADQAVEIVARSLCIKQFVLNAGNLVKYLSVQLMASRYIAIFVLEAGKKPKIIEGAIDFRKRILIVTKLPLKLILEVILVKEIMMN